MQKKISSACGIIGVGVAATLAANSPLVAQMYDGQTAPPRNQPPRERPPHERPSRNQPPRIDGPSVEDLTRVLDLTPEQQKTVQDAIDQAQKTIDAALTDSQRARLKSLRERHHPPPPGAGRESANGQDEDHGRPVDLVARDLGVTPEQFRAAFRKVRPAPRGQRPTEAQRRANRKVLSETLGVSPEKLDEVMDKYRPGERGDNGPQGPPPEAPPPPVDKPGE